MEGKKLFVSMSPDARRFYSRIINTAVLNLHAVRTGLFDILLCETNDPAVARRWKESLPNIIQSMEERHFKKFKDEANKKAGE